MRHELTLAAALLLTAEPTHHRRAIRLASDDLIAALAGSDLEGIARESAGTMLAAASSLVAAQAGPGAEQLIAAAQALIAHAREGMDRALKLSTGPEDLAQAAVGLHIVVRGICTLLGLPYDETLAEVAAAEAEGRPPVLLPILAAAGRA